MRARISMSDHGGRMRTTSLWRLAVGGMTTAERDLWIRLEEQVRRLVVRLVGRDRELGLVEDTLSHCLLCMNQFDNRGVGLRPWIHRVAKNYIVTRLRVRSQRPVPVSLQDAPEQKARRQDHPSDAAISRETARALIHDLANESPRLRNLCLLILRGVPMKLAAGPAGYPTEASARSELARFVRHVRERFSLATDS